MRMDKRIFAVSLLTLLGAGSATGASPPPEAGRWREIRARDTDFTQSKSRVGVDPTGTVWLPLTNALVRWDGKEWSTVGDAKGPIRGFHLRGDSSRGLYLLQQTDIRLEGRLRPLAGTEALPPIPFYREDEPGIFVASSGRVFQFAARNLGVLEDGSWKSVEAPLSDPRSVDVVDMGPGGPVLFFPHERSTAALFDGSALHPAVPLPDFGDLSGPSRRRVRFTRFGKDLVIPWAPVAPLGSALRVEGTKLVLAELPPVLRGPRVLAVRPDGLGGIWLVDDFTARNTNPPPPWFRTWWIRHVDSSGTVQEYGVLPGEQASVTGGVHEEFPSLSAGDGSLWLAAGPRIYRFRAGEARVMGWRQGLGSAPITALAEGPDGRIFASGEGGIVWLWEEDAPPDPARLLRWSGFRSRSAVLRTPGGDAWVFPVEKEGVIALLGGSSPGEFPAHAPAHGRLMPLYADDAGGLIYVDHGSNGSIHVAGVPGPARFTGVREAVLARVAAGATVFTGHQQPPPIVGSDGRVWMVGRENSGVDGYMGGRWEEFRLGHVTELTLAADGTTPLVLREHECLSYVDGTWKVAMLPRDGTIQVVGSDWRYGGRLLTPDPRLAPAWISTHLFTGRSPDRGDWRVVTWAEAEPVLRGEATLPIIPTGVGWRSGVPAWAIPDGTGGFYGNSGRSRVRVTEGRVVPAHGTGTPLDDVSVRDVGFGTGGRLLAVIPLEGEGGEVLLDRTGAPGIRPGPAEVVRSRSVSIPWEGDPSLIAVELREAGAPSWTSFPAPAPATWHAAAPGRRGMTFEMRGRDSLGLAGPVAVLSTEIDAAFPWMRWESEEAPREIGEARWRVPVVVEWTGHDVPRAIEVRIDGGKWEPLPGDGTVLLAAFHGRAVSLEVRAVEEGLFPSPTLSTTAHVGVDLDAWIREGLRSAAAGDRRALQDLWTVREDALRILDEILAADPAGDSKLRDLRSSLAPMRCVPIDGER